MVDYLKEKTEETEINTEDLEKTKKEALYDKYCNENRGFRHRRATLKAVDRHIKKLVKKKAINYQYIHTFENKIKYINIGNILVTRSIMEKII